MTLVFEKRCNSQIRPKVTIGICVKNCADLVKDAIKSVINQDFPHRLMEIIVVDDGSEDKTLSVIIDLVSKINMQIKVFHSKWRGLGPSRNTVVENARGDYIIWVDSDMILPKDHVRRQVEFMEKNPKIGVAKARYGLLTDNKKIISFLENMANIAADVRFGGKYTDKTLGTGGSIYRTSVIRKIGFDWDVKGVGEDMVAEFKIKNSGWLLYRGSPAFFYERFRNSLTSIWNEAFWHGYKGHQILRRVGRPYMLLLMTPFAALFIGTIYAVTAYKFAQNKKVFLLPFLHTFKRIAWFSGFVKGLIDREYRFNYFKREVVNHK